MGGKIGAGVGLPYSSESPDASAPSGRLQVFESKDFPYLHTGHSLVFTIARNGHVWGKRLDNESAKGDIELEVFWPSEDGCLIQTQGSCGNSNSVVLRDPLPVYISLSQSQRDKINSILSQKETIQYELGTLMVWPHRDWLRSPQYQRMTTACKLDFPTGKSCDIKVVDCLYKDKNISNLRYWHISYEPSQSRFSLTVSDNLKNDYGVKLYPSDTIYELSNFDVDRAGYPGASFHAVQARDKKFDMNHSALSSKGLFKGCLKIMYGEHDFFEYFEVDDAMLLCEQQHDSRDVPPKLYWTLGIAQNKHIREMLRLASNNPDLFAPLLESLQKQLTQHVRVDHGFRGGMEN